MKGTYPVESRLAVRSGTRSLVAVGMVLLVAAILVTILAAPNPLTVALPVGGTVATTAMVWSIDRLHTAGRD